MFFRLFLIFVLVPAAEIAILIKVGSAIGAWNTVAIVILTALAGAYMVRLEGIGVMYRIQRDLQEGIFPADELVNGLMVLVAGVLLITPGFITDIAGFLLVFPATREVLKKLARRYFEKRLGQGGPY
jgi:UPF0716 protein FxsA